MSRADQRERFVSGGPDGSEPTSLVRDVDRLVHKFRTPLNSLSLNADLLGSVSTPKQGKEPLYARALKSLQAEVQRLDRIAGDFQRYVAVGTPKPAKVSPAELIQNAVKELGDASQKPEVMLAKGLPGVDVDPRLVVAALAELLKNAVEAGGKSAPKVEVRSAKDTVEFLVSDSGGGIELDPPDRAFELFFSVKQGHLGFGLTYARRVARASGGDVFIDKTGATGTTVRLTLPVA